MDAAASDSARANDVIATYTDVEAARAAITILERHGVEGGAIELDAPGASDAPVTNDAQRDADMEATGQIGKRAGVGLLGGAVLGAVLGVVLGVAISAIFDIATPVALGLAGALGLGMFGAYAGGFYGGATGLPVSESWGETYAAEQTAGSGPTRLAVHLGGRSDVDDVVQALRGTGALRLQRADDQGRLADA